jgi:hypothetical protein
MGIRHIDDTNENMDMTMASDQIAAHRLDSLMLAADLSYLERDLIGFSDIWLSIQAQKS